MPLALLLVLGNIAASRPDPAKGGISAGATEVTVVAEELSLVCDDPLEPVCEVRAVYHLHNPLDAPEQVTVEFVGERATNVRFSPAGPTVTVEKDLTLTVLATMRPGRYFVPSYGRSAVETRHLLLGSQVPHSDVFDLEYAIAPLRTWAGMPKAIAVRVTAPAGWKLGSGDASGDGELVLSVDPQVTGMLHVRLTPPRRRWFHGGPFVGAGAAFSYGAATGTGFRARFGYEIAAPEWLFISLAAETDFQRQLTLAPVLHAASAGLLTVVPSGSIGAGPAFDVAPVFRAGVRVQLTLHWPVLGVVFVADGLFDTPLTPPLLRFSLMGQVGL